MNQVLSVRPIRFSFHAEDRIFIPPGKHENLFRGALGLSLKKVCCEEECQGREVCDAEPVCGYRRIFAPKLAEGPSGVADPPRPFVLRVGRRSEGWIERGRELEIGANVFDADPEILRYLVVAFAQLGGDGIGPGRGRCRLRVVEQSGTRLFADGRQLVRSLPEPEEISLEGGEPGEGRLVVEFVTPTEIKSEGVVVARPEFRVLMARVRDRVASLMTLYQGGPPEVDFAGFLEDAAQVRLVDEGLEERSGTRVSSRTGQRHAIGGSVGKVVYEGPVGRYVPWLRAAEWTGVGRQTVWGKGQIRVQVER